MSTTSNASPGRNPRSHQERCASAAETFRRFVPEAEPERVAASFSRRLGPLGTFAFEAVGDMWNRPGLARRDRSLMIVSLLATQARGEELIAHTQIGVRHGLTRTEIEEILPMVAAYAGFPAAMAASREIDEGLRLIEGVEQLSPRTRAAAKSDAERERDAARVRAALTGLPEQDPVQDLAELTFKLGDLGGLTYRWTLGEIWARPELSLRDRSIVVISILTALVAEQMLPEYIEGGLRNGLRREEIEEMLTHLGLYAGLAHAAAAMLVAKAVFDTLAEGESP